MKKLSNFLILGLAVITFASCGNTNTNTDPIQITDTETRGGVEFHEFQGQQITLNTAEVVVMQKAQAAEDDDAAFAANLFSNLQAAEANQSLAAEVKFNASDEPVENGMFIFSVGAEESKQLTVEMYDEEGFEMAANNTIGINAGNNYKALNVKSLDNGDYIFRLKDQEGKELSRKVVIENN